MQPEFLHRSARVSFPQSKKDDVVFCRYPVINSLGSAWRVRAINDAGIPGPWAGLKISDPDLASAIRNFIQVNGVQACFTDKFQGTVDVTWDIPHNMDGLSFEVERKSSHGDSVVRLDVGAGHCRDRVEMITGVTYAYRIRTTLFDVHGNWSFVTRNCQVVVEGPLPSVVSGLQAASKMVGTTEVSWAGSRYPGYSMVKTYEVECLSWNGSWEQIDVINADTACEPLTVVESGLEFADYTYRVRCINEFGPGPWSEVAVSKSAMQECLRRAFVVTGLSCSPSPDGRGLNFIWDVGQLLDGMVFKIARRVCNQVTVLTVNDTKFSEELRLSKGGHFKYSVRSVAAGYIGPWSDVLGIVVSDGAERDFTPPNLLRFNGTSKIVMIDRASVALGEPTVLSYDADIAGKDAWAFAGELLRSGTPVLCKIKEHNTGGLLVDWNGLSGFVPYSLTVAQSKASANLRVGKSARFKIKEIRKKEFRFRGIRIPHREMVLTELGIWDKFEGADFLDNLEKGQLIRGTIRSIVPYGAFVNLGMVDGLLHVSEMAESRVSDPEEVVSVGDQVEVRVVKVNKHESKVALSLRQAKPSPWSTVGERYRIGDVVEGTVSNLADFGAFVRLESEVEGLVHISELSSRRVRQVSEVVRKGQQITVEIISIDTERKRIGLSYRRINP